DGRLGWLHVGLDTKPRSYHSGCRPRRGSGLTLDVLEVDRATLDADTRGRDPVGHLAGLEDRLLHQALDVRVVGLVRQPRVLPRFPVGGADRAALRVEMHAGVDPGRAVETGARQGQLEIDAFLGDDLVPLVEPALAVGDVLVAEHLVHRVAEGHFLL